MPNHTQNTLELTGDHEMVTVRTNTLLEGDALAPQWTDLIVQRGSLDVGQPVPAGWRVLTGNNDSSLVARVVYRFEVE